MSVLGGKSVLGEKDPKESSSGTVLGAPKEFKGTVLGGVSSPPPAEKKKKKKKPKTKKKKGEMSTQAPAPSKKEGRKSERVSQ